MNFIFFGSIAALLIIQSAGDCAMHNYCNGHGSCVSSSSTCLCYEGWGASTDITYYRAPDCSARTCPSGRAWADVPTSSTVAHAFQECSNRGTCDRVNGQCTCFDGFSGPACNRNKCPNDCSGHGQCVSMKDLAQLPNALPLNANTYYEGYESTITWDEDMSYACLCDSSWDVGLASGQTQEPEWFGPDCSKRHCPSGDDPMTVTIETNCNGVTAANSNAVGSAGNLCQVDCANRGICNYDTGLCQCFNGFYGVNCINQDVLANYGA